ncbi:MAG: hypothetical protein QXZ64_03790 [Candidatus Bathyarchaeia archaeon]
MKAAYILLTLPLVLLLTTMFGVVMAENPRLTPQMLRLGFGL